MAGIDGGEGLWVMKRVINLRLTTLYFSLIRHSHFLYNFCSHNHVSLEIDTRTHAEDFRIFLGRILVLYPMDVHID